MDDIFETVSLVGGPLDGDQRTVAKEARFFMCRIDNPEPSEEDDEMLQSGFWVTYRRGPGRRFYCDVSYRA